MAEKLPDRTNEWQKQKEALKKSNVSKPILPNEIKDDKKVNQ